MVLRELTLDDFTRQLLGAYLKRPKHALLLSGSIGSGLGTLADVLANEITSRRTDIVTIVPDEKGTIPIERIRALYTETRGTHSSRQIVVIDDIDRMSHDAQHAFLKLLEEPNHGVHFILTSHTPQSLLPTIMSRVEHIAVKKITNEQSQRILIDRGIADTATLQQILFLASGLPAELSRLSADTAYFADQASSVRRARDFLSGTMYARLVIAARITSRADAVAFVQMLARLVQFGVTQHRVTIHPTRANMLETVAARLEANGHIKTQLLFLAVSL